MEAETLKQVESSRSGGGPVPADTGSSDGDRLQDLREPEEQADAQTECNGQDATSPEGDSECATEADRSPQETPVAVKVPDNVDDPPLVPSRPPDTADVAGEPCWYCLRSLDAQYRAEAPRQENPDPLPTSPPGGQKVSYQTDPRPHFGVACSSHAPCRPLWGSEGPCWALRDEEVPEQTHSCPHCHLGLSPDTLRWHEAKCLVFEGRNSKK